MRQPDAPSKQVSAPEKGLGKEGAFKLVFRSRYLLLIALMMLLLNWVNTTGEYILSRVVTEAAHEAVAAGTSGELDVKDTIGTFYAGFFGTVNLVSALIQLLLVSRIIKYLGVRIAIMILPLIALGGYALIVVFPLLTAVRTMKIAENATDYSLQNTIRGVLFLPTTREEKYKAKQAIDTFFVRMGDVLQAALVFVGTTWLAFETKHFAMFNGVLALVWLALALAIGREYARQVERQKALPATS